VSACNLYNIKRLRAAILVLEQATTSPKLLTLLAQETLSNPPNMTSVWTSGRRPWHRRVLSRLLSAFRRQWNKFIYYPCEALTRVLVRWLYGLKPPLITKGYFSARELAAPAPLPLIRKRRLSITWSDSSEAPTISPRFLGKFIGTRNQEQYTATQDQCLLFTKLPLELRLLIYRFVLGDLTLHIIPSHAPSLTLPPRFSLRTHPFRRRLDFEFCKSAHHYKKAKEENAVAIFEDPELCTQERSKQWEFNGLVQSYSMQRDKGNADWAFWARYFLSKHGRKNGLLALLKTCRVMYVVSLLRKIQSMRIELTNRRPVIPRLLRSSTPQTYSPSPTPKS